MKRRGSNDIWEGLYEFLLLEADDSATSPHTLLSKILPDFISLGFSNLSLAHEKKHILTHQNIYAKFWMVEFEDESTYLSACRHFDLQSFLIDEIHELPKPVLINNFLINHIF